MTFSLNLPTASLRRPSGGQKISTLARSGMAQDIKGALGRWRQLWQTACSKSADKSMKTEGMFRNGYLFWLVAQLILNNDEAVDVITRMEVNCEDAMTKLKVLLQNENEQEA